MGVAAWECNRRYIFSPTKVNETQDVHRAIRVNFLGSWKKLRLDCTANVALTFLVRTETWQGFTGQKAGKAIAAAPGR